MDRTQLALQRIGAPAMAAYGALVNAATRENWPDFQRQPADYYANRMVAGWLPRLIDGALTEARLQDLPADEVATFTLLLLRDMFRHNSALLRPQAQGAGWVETLFAAVASGIGLPPSRLKDDGRPYELEDIDACQWAKTLAAPFGIIPEKLFITHGAIVMSAREEFRWGRRGSAPLDSSD
jgi:hypothetical protein